MQTTSVNLQAAQLNACSRIMKRMNLGLRPLWLLILLVLTFAIGMASILNYFKYENTLKKLQRSTFHLVAADVHESLQRSLALGGSLAETPTLQDLIERQRGASPLILSIDILDATGMIIFSTEAQRVLTLAPAPWTKAGAASATGAWSVSDDRAFVIGRIVKNNFDIAVGGVALRYERAALDNKLAHMMLYLAGVGLVAMCAAGVLAFLGLLFLGGLIRRDFAVASSAFTGNTPAPSRRLTALEREMLAARAGIESAERAVAGVVSAMADSAATVSARSAL